VVDEHCLQRRCHQSLPHKGRGSRPKPSRIVCHLKWWLSSNRAVVGTPEEAVPRVRTILDAGFQYVIFVVLPFDTETPCLLAEHVLPAAVNTNERLLGHQELPRFDPDS
jgi:hypothetical protein